MECLSEVTRSQVADGGQVGREKLISVSEKLLVYDLCDLKISFIVLLKLGRLVHGWKIL